MWFQFQSMCCQCKHGTHVVCSGPSFITRSHFIWGMKQWFEAVITQMKEFYARQLIIKNATEAWCSATNTLAGIEFQFPLMCCQCKRCPAGQHVGARGLPTITLMQLDLTAFALRSHRWENFTQDAHKSRPKRRTEDYKNGRSNKYFTTNFRGIKIKKNNHSKQDVSLHILKIYLGLSSCHVPQWIIKRYCAGSVQCNWWYLVSVAADVLSVETRHARAWRYPHRSYTTRSAVCSSDLMV